MPRVVPLADDMTSFDPAQVRVLDGLVDFREAPWVVRTGDVYHLTWSCDDTRSPDYRVGYATGPTPYGPWAYHGVLLEKRPELGIVGAGHHSVAQAHDGNWYIAYHRIAVPDGDGTHRETCIDRLTIGDDGRFRPVVPTLDGIEPLHAGPRGAPPEPRTLERDH